MKKFILSILIFMLFIPFVVNAETCDANKVSISSIKVENKSDTVEEINPPSINGMSINLDLNMFEVGDNIKYELIVKNEGPDDYELDENKFNISYDYIDFKIESEDNSNIVKVNTSKKLYLNVVYKNEVPDSAYNNGVYNNTKTINIDLSNNNSNSNNNQIINPKTGKRTILLTIILLIALSGIVCIVITKKKKYMVLIICIALIIPISIYATCKVSISIESNVNILKNSSFYVYTANYNSNQVIIGQALSNNITIYNTPEEASAGIYSYNDLKFFFKHKIENDIVTESYLGFIIPDEMVQSNPGMVAGTYLLRGAGATINEEETQRTGRTVYNDDSIYYENNIEILKQAFGYDTMPSRCESTQNNNFHCSNIWLYHNGRIHVTLGNVGCDVFYNGISYCASD